MDQRTEIELDVKRLALAHVPTRESKLAIYFLLLAAPGVAVLLEWLNPLWPALEVGELRKVQLLGGLVLLTLVSLYINVHLTRKLRALGKFIDNTIPELVEKYAKK